MLGTHEENQQFLSRKHLVSVSQRLLTSDLLLTKARKPRSKLAEEFRDP